MKHKIFLIAIMLMTGISAQAQVLLKKSGEQVKFDADKLVRIVPVGDSLVFETQQGATQTFRFSDLQFLGFAQDYTSIKEVEATQKSAILYDASTSTIHVVNAATLDGTLSIYHPDGRLAKRGKGTMLAVSELKSGLYVASYNQKLNVKFIKK